MPQIKRLVLNCEHRILWMQILCNPMEACQAGFYRRFVYKQRSVTCNTKSNSASKWELLSPAGNFGKFKYFYFLFTIFYKCLIALAVCIAP